VTEPTRCLYDVDDFMHPDVLADPYPLYAHLREHDPVHWNARLDSWMLLRYADVLGVVMDHERFASDRTRQFMEALPVGLDLMGRMRGSMMIFSDPPRHTRLRGQVNRWLTARTAEAARAHVSEVADHLLEPALERGETDLVADVAAPLPAMVNARVMGLPEDDSGLLKRWTADFVAALSAGGLTEGTPVLQRGQEAVSGLVDYLTVKIEERRRRPAVDLLTALASARDEGSLASDDELLGTCINLLFAGFETVVNLIGNGTLALLRHPEQLALLRSRPQLLRGAVEEMLRYDCPVQFVSRLVLEDIELGDRRLRRGQRVFIGLAPANRDPAQIPDPDRFDINRVNNRHLTFSQGIHYCPGAALARLEAEITFRRLLDRFARIELRPGPLAWHRNMTFRGLTALPLVLGAAEGTRTG
jgi:pimeloyl-[acyl-carrier protein] synthase